MHQIYIYQRVPPENREEDSLQVFDQSHVFVYVDTLLDIVRYV